MKITLAPRAVLRAAIVASAIVLIGCTSGVGPISAADSLSRMQAAHQADGPVTLAIPVAYQNRRLNPSFADALLLGARNLAEPRTVALTETSLLVLMWSQGQYYLIQRIPYDGIKDIKAVASRAIEVETTDPMHIALGRPEQTGLFYVNSIDPDTGFGDSVRARQLYTALLRNIQRRRPDFSPSVPLPPAS